MCLPGPGGRKKLPIIPGITPRTMQTNKLPKFPQLNNMHFKLIDSIQHIVF